MDILTEIDTAIGCQRCGGPLDESPSSDFCSEPCQLLWSRARVRPLAVKRSAAVALAELQTSHALAMDAFGRRIAPMIHAMGAGLSEAFAHLSRSVGALHAELVRAGVAATPSEDPKARALYLVRRRNTGPARRTRAPRTINARGVR